MLHCIIRTSGTKQKNYLSEVPTTRDTVERMAVHYDGNLRNRTLQEYVSKKCFEAERPSSTLSQEQCTSSTALCYARLELYIEPTNHIMWPDTPKCKGKRQAERQPSAVISEKYGENIEQTMLRYRDV